MTAAGELFFCDGGGGDGGGGTGGGSGGGAAAFAEFALIIEWQHRVMRIALQRYEEPSIQCNTGEPVCAPSHLGEHAE